MMKILLIAGALDQSVDVGIGQDLSVSLSENGGTGFRWSLLDPDSRVVQADAGRVEAPADPAPGAAAQRVFTLRTLAAGTVTLTFVLKREWESAPPAKTAALRVSVR